MTVSINTFQDILNALEQEPSLRDELRRHLLSEDLLHLPVLLAQHMTDFAEFVRLTREHNEITNRRLERLEGDVAELKDGQARLEGDVAELKGGQARLEGDVAELKDGQARLEGDVAGLKTTVGAMEGNMTELKTTVGAMGGNVSQLVGRNYEAHAARIGSRRLRKRMNLENARAVTHPPHGDPSFLTEIANLAEKNGVITSEQANDLEQGDLVFTSADANGTQFYILAEVSLTVQKSDAERARRRAAILEQATGIATTPITIGELIASDAEEETVVFIALPRAQE